MDIEFSKHALDQLKLRSTIKRYMVVNTLKNPDKIISSYRGRYVYRKQFNKDFLEVVALEEDNKLVVITEYFLE